MTKKEKKVVDEKIDDEIKNAKPVKKSHRKSIITCVFIFLILGVGWWQWSVVEKVTKSMYGLVADTLTEVSQYVSLSSISVREVDGISILTRKGLSSTLSQVPEALAEWGSSEYQTRYVVFGGSLIRSQEGELLWLINGTYVSVRTISRKFKSPGLWVVNNPSLEVVPGSFVTDGYISVYRPRRLGFLWKKNTLGIKSNNFRGEFNTPDDFNFKFVAYSKYEKSRYKSELTPMIK